jgi:Amt family ammonium transporter
MLVAGVPALIMCLLFEKFGGLRVSEETELVGVDVTQWGVSNFDDDLRPPTAAPTTVTGSAGVAVPTARSSEADGVPA